MRINTFKQFKFTADLYLFDSSRDSAGGEIRTYYLDRNINLRAATSTAGRIFVWCQESEGDVAPGVLLGNFRDSNGEEFRPDGVFQVMQIEPQINLWGFREGFKGVAEYFANDQAGGGGGGTTSPPVDTGGE